MSSVQTLDEDLARGMPLLLYDLETGEFYFLNSRLDRLRSEYLSYSSGAVTERKELWAQHCELLCVLKMSRAGSFASRRRGRSSRSNEPSGRSIDDG